MKEVQFRLDINTKVLWWKSLLREVVEIHLQKYSWSGWSWRCSWPLQESWTRCPSKVPPNPKCSMMFRSCLTTNFEEKWSVHVHVGMIDTLQWHSETVIGFQVKDVEKTHLCLRAEAAAGCEAAAAGICWQDLGRGELCQCYLDPQEGFWVPAELHTVQHKAAATVWSLGLRAELRVHLLLIGTHTGNRWWQCTQVDFLGI